MIQMVVILKIMLHNEYLQDEGGSHDSYDDSSSDDEHTWTQEVKKQHKLLRQEDRMRERENKLKFYELKEGQSFKSLEDKKKRKEMK